VTVLDTSALVDYLVGTGVAGQVSELFEQQAPLAAPDVLVFEVLAVLRRQNLTGALSSNRAAGAVEDLGSSAIELFGSITLRGRVWELRNNFTAADALFVALAEDLDEPLATKDSSLALAVSEHTRVAALLLDGAH
jgi:predicted nucleic acid-binding protein